MQVLGTCWGKGFYLSECGKDSRGAPEKFKHKKHPFKRRVSVHVSSCQNTGARDLLGERFLCICVWGRFLSRPGSLNITSAAFQEERISSRLLLSECLCSELNGGKVFMYLRVVEILRTPHEKFKYQQHPFKRRASVHIRSECSW